MAVSRRADLTYQHNVTNGRHGWLRLTPAYSVKIVDEIIRSHPQSCNIFDPFSGTATTPLCASTLHHPAAAIDINPFLVWFGQAKLATYQKADIYSARKLAGEIIKLLSDNGSRVDMVPAPPLHNIARWWNEHELQFLRKLKYCIDTLATEGSQVWTLLTIAFCRTMIRTSNAAFDHQSMSFKESNPYNLLQLMTTNTDRDSELALLFQQDSEIVLNSATNNPALAANVALGDARNIGKHIHHQYELIITSPPYPNRMSYIRELRPYMYWLGYFNEAREAGELDWQAIGGTWGIATSRLQQWRRSNDTCCPTYLHAILAQIAQAENRHSQLLATYIAKYFEDIWTHLNSMMPVIASGGEVYYIVGNSMFYNILLPVEQIYRDMLLELGLVDVSIEVLRKRNSKKELLEYKVSGHKR